MLRLLISLTLLAGASATGPAGCVACPADDSPKAATTAGCFNCTAVSNSATGAVLSCAAEGAQGTGTLAAAPATTPATDHNGRKCAPGYFYTAPNGTANATCQACATGCNTCTAAGATACTSPKAGYYKASNGTATACTAVNV